MISLERFQKIILDYVDDGCRTDHGVVFKFEHDRDFSHDVYFEYRYCNEYFLQISGFAENCKVSVSKLAQALVYCNNRNYNYRLPYLFINQNYDLIGTLQAFLGDNATDNYIIETLKLGCNSIWLAFVKAPNIFQ